MLKKALPEPFKIRLDIYKANGEYDKAKIQKIDIEKLNFICSEAQAYNKEINDNIKTTGTRATWLLGILIVIILGSGNIIFRDLYVSVAIITLEPYIKTFITGLLFTHLLAVVLSTRVLTRLNYGIHVHNEPKNKLTKKLAFEDNIKIIIIREIEYQQDKINSNMETDKKLSNRFNRLRGYFILSPFLSLVFTFAILHF